VSRSALIEAAKASGCRVVGITAPAGYGKSTLLSQWALAEDRRVAWVSLDGFDDDPAALLTLLASAYARVSPGNENLVADMGGGADRPDRRSAAVVRAPRRRFVRSGASGGHVVRICAKDVAGHHVCRRSRADDERGQHCVAQEPPWSPWRDTALYLNAEAHLLTGNVDQACALFAESSSVADMNSNVDCLVLSESELALVAMDRGRWEEAARRLERALAVADEHRMQDYATSVLVVAVAARHAVHRGDLEQADRLITRAMRARPSCTFAMPFIAVGVRIQLAKVHLARGDVSTARHLLREIDDILLHRPDLGALVDEVSALRALLTASTQGERGAPPLTAAELRLLPYLQTHLTFAEIAKRLFVSRNTVGSEVTSIYRKLGVASRADAVGKATAVGLLGA